MFCTPHTDFLQVSIAILFSTNWIFPHHCREADMSIFFFCRISVDFARISRFMVGEKSFESCLYGENKRDGFLGKEDIQSE